MKGKKFITRVFAIIMIGAGMFSCTEVVAGKLQVAPRVLKTMVGFPGDGMASYAVDPGNGCIQKFFYKNGEQIKPKWPSWLVEGKKTVDFGSFTDSKCRQGVIGIGGSPTEYWGYAYGSYYCIGAWDPECPPYGRWYQPCLNHYPSCP